ncbi:nitroreductase/quinone reductase family protein [Nocardioides nematodiphilus]|uniref:nitroreductase/quinone reductase family protein n=1 Tax=Nocardioides nematodiphilus TaxID=2849669 RepID=UPI001CD9683A|nr:nitroreductase/quinone reductase family protein [Nocardioides nematodiphilus]MCA1982062.1 nitroreductase family deazaflavin-dependent oxidoreductase [Nocardioides nematodiphilus]
MPLPSERPPGLDSPWTTRLIKYGAKANTAIFRATKGRLGATWRISAGWRNPVPILLLEHVGRTSGKRFTAPLVYLEDGPRLIVVASQGGLPTHPQWFRNVQVTPDTAVILKGEGRRQVRARVASAEEKAELWPRMVALYADFDTYQGWTDREIPIVILDPR